MKKFVLFFLFFNALLSCNNMSRLYVQYGQEKDKPVSGDTSIRIFLDRKGFVYPTGIDNARLKGCDTRLESYYQRYSNEYIAKCSLNNVAPYGGNWDLVNASNEPLQKALVDNNINDINRLSKDREVVLIIHGYNEHPTLPNNNYSSTGEIATTQNNIAAAFPGRNFLFVEVYWDGMSADNGSSLLKPTNSLKIWDNAQASATYAGLELRRILRGLNSQNIFVITHSHGAGVITTALFNVKKFRQELYSDSESWLFDINSRYSNPIYNTPLQSYHVGMLAPAIPGQNVFDEYGRRTINGIDSLSGAANYHFVVGFNENDPVTRKYKVAAKKLGSTTLACKRGELARTLTLLGNNRSKMEYEDFSRNHLGEKQSDHSWLEYMLNMPHFSDFLTKVFN